MRELLMKWGGSDYRCRVSHDVIMQIENKVTLQGLASKITSNSDDIPTSHVAWVYYCLLKSAGAPVTTDDVWLAVKDQKADPSTLEAVMGFIFAEVYGVGPEDSEGIEPAKKT
jgi:hypothetical protein